MAAAAAATTLRKALGEEITDLRLQLEDAKQAEARAVAEASELRERVKDLEEQLAALRKPSVRKTKVATKTKLGDEASKTASAPKPLKKKSVAKKSADGNETIETAKQAESEQTDKAQNPPSPLSSSPAPSVVKEPESEGCNASDEASTTTAALRDATPVPKKAAKKKAKAPEGNGPEAKETEAKCLEAKNEATHEVAAVQAPVSTAKEVQAVMSAKLAAAMEERRRVELARQEELDRIQAAREEEERREKEEEARQREERRLEEEAAELRRAQERATAAAAAALRAERKAERRRKAEEDRRLMAEAKANYSPEDFAALQLMRAEVSLQPEEEESPDDLSEDELLEREIARVQQEALTIQEKPKKVVPRNIMDAYMMMAGMLIPESEDSSKRKKREALKEKLQAKRELAALQASVRSRRF